MDLQMEWFDADLDMKLTSGNDTLGFNGTLSQGSNHVPYIRKDLFGLIIKSGFLDTKYGCTVGEEKIGNTTLVILASFFIGEQIYDVSDYFEESETDMDAKENSEVVLNCTVKSEIAPAVVSWRRNPGAKLLTQDEFNFAEEEGYALEVVDSRSYLLTLSNAKASHAGSYVCQTILNEIEVYSKNFTLSVQDVIKGNLSGSTYVSCDSPSVQFIRKGKVLVPEKAESPKYQWDVDENVTTLIITDTTEADGGTYICVSREDPEVILRNVVVGFPAEVMLNVSNLRVSTVVGSQVSLEWDSPVDDPFAKIEEYEVTYFEKDHMDDAVTLRTADTKALLPFLEEQTEYGFQVRVKTSMGWGAFSKPIYQKTGKHIEETGTTTTEASTATTPSGTDEDGVEEEEEVEEELTTVSPSPTPEYDYDVSKEKKEDVDKGEPVSEAEEEIEEIEDYNEYEEEAVTTPPLPFYEQIVLPCDDYTNPDEVTWKRGDQNLFLGQLDVGGHPNLSLSPKGELILGEGYTHDIRDDDAYTCYIFDLSEFQDVEVVTYRVSLNGEETVVTKSNESDFEIPEEEDSSDLQFDLEEEVAVLANSERVGKKMVEVLKTGGLKVRLLDISKCNVTDVRGWMNAEEAMKTCEYQARQSGELTDEESIFMGFDFFVELTPSSWFAVTQLYLHNVRRDISVNVFAPMVPVPASSIIQPPGADEPVLIQVTDSWWNTLQGTDKSVGSGLKASILSLQESYLNLINGQSREAS